MNTEPQEKNSGTEGKQEESGTSTPKPVSIRDEHEPRPQQETGDPKRYNEPPTQEPLRWFQGWRVNRELDAVNTVASIIGLAALFILFYQSGELKRTNELAEKSLKVADESLRLAKEGFDESKKSGVEEAARAERALGATEKLANASTVQADAAIDSADATKTLTQANKSQAIAAIQSVQIAQDALRAGSSPIITTDKYMLSEFKSGSRFAVRVGLQNVGQTTAVGFTGQVTCILRTTELVDPPIVSVTKGVRSQTNLAPFQIRYFTAITDMTIDQTVFDAIKQEKIFLF